MSEPWLINGRPEKKIPASDRGLAYGDGLFETMRVIRGRIPLQNRHLDRLARGCEVLGIVPDIPRLEADIGRALKDLQPTDGQAVLKLLVTRSGAAVGYRERDFAHNIYLHLVGIKQPVESTPLISAMLCTTRLAQNPGLAGLKHLNRLEQVLAANELDEDCDEGILMDTQGQIVECIAGNLIGIKASSQVPQLCFPDLSQAGVRGVMHSLVRELATDLNYDILDEHMIPADLGQFDEILCCNAVRGIRNVGNIRDLWRGSVFRIGDRLRATLRQETASDFYSY